MIPWTKSGLFTLFTYTLTGLFANVLSFYGLSYPDTSQAVVCGARVIDVERLRDNTEYDDDLSPEDAHICIFWEVLQAFTEVEKSAFLRFIWAR
jgi:hypothetical protein